MSYRANQCQQLSIFDRSLHLTERERKCLENSWAKVFSDEIFPAIDEERFRVLYSDNASRPNTPVNVIVGALIIKELWLFGYSCGSKMASSHTAARTWGFWMSAR